ASSRSEASPRNSMRIGLAAMTHLRMAFRRRQRLADAPVEDAQLDAAHDARDHEKTAADGEGGDPRGQDGRDDQDRARRDGAETGEAEDCRGDEATTRRLDDLERARGAQLNQGDLGTDDPA